MKMSPESRCGDVQNNISLSQLTDPNISIWYFSTLAFSIWSEANLLFGYIKLVIFLLAQNPFDIMK